MLAERAFVRPGRESGNRMRQRLLALLEVEPGICVTAAARRLGSSTQGITYHARVLARRDALVVVERGAVRHLFLNGTATPCSRRLLPALQAPSVRVAADQLAARGVLEASWLRDQGRSRATSRRVLAQLVEEGVAHRARGRIIAIEARRPCLERALRAEPCRCASRSRQAPVQSLPETAPLLAPA
jgi:hypothetical protein